MDLYAGHRPFLCARSAGEAIESPQETQGSGRKRFVLLQAPGLACSRSQCVGAKWRDRTTVGLSSRYRDYGSGALWSWGFAYQPRCVPRDGREVGRGYAFWDYPRSFGGLFHVQTLQGSGDQDLLSSTDRGTSFRAKRVTEPAMKRYLK